MQKNYQSTIISKSNPIDTFDKINQVGAWWAEDFSGKSETLGDIFTVRFKGGDMYKCKVSKLNPSKEIVWEVIDSDQTWHDKHNEWNGTKVVWEITPDNNGSKITMTHQGLVPEFECFDQCKLGWDYLTQKSLLKLLAEGKGLPA